MTTTFSAADVTDPHDLISSGEELATEAELARILGVSRNVLRQMLHGVLYTHVRFVRYANAAWRYCVSDARAAIEPHRPAIEARRREAAEREVAERAAAAARRADKVPESKPLSARRPTATPRAPLATQSPKQHPLAGPSTRPAVPEVIVRRGPRA
jgi:nucleoid-associated protein YgaU